MRLRKLAAALVMSGVIGTLGVTVAPSASAAGYMYLGPYSLTRCRQLLTVHDAGAQCVRSGWPQSQGLYYLRYWQP
ncbi:hypothetical protein [Cellulomonas fimi]|uniref:Uncharacterized protein n=1 Tax=Cellulomonas fimi (strain ATCC 484 / DSM 20113 / JCM 1341 / CCUG 24087 / LMG 16345 / NBRC 15513 / NCIMB 8980 / NCTC 7547 / NRS-133) TaxID=590998 RepID=F4H1P4_CELFA|nr:hypothetical protein [Cellulomonas fimi]AEE47464.1 hypothetical protein Celf_3351 [Cellulomonas fimi ATCC 484]NNH05559.1 hypothetical protein [Cellulomonas fimi]VEH36293.1 Uncharacterised protein [Cellulomonas fimi]